MIIALTGATGFIGERLQKRLRADDHDLRLVSRRGPFTWERIGEAVEGAAAVIHLAGEPVAQRWTPEAKQRIRDSRVRTTRAVVEAIASASDRPSVLVSASAIGYYGSRGDEILTESSSPGTGFLPDVCAEWEAEAAAAVRSGVRVAMARIGIVLGAEGGMLKQVLTPFRLGVGGPLGDGHQWMSWIHVDDLVEMLVFAATTPAVSGPFNAVAPEPVRNADFTKALGAAVHRPAMIPVPAFGLKLAFGEMAQVILASQRVVPEAIRRAGFDYNHPDLSRGLEEAVRS